MAGYKTKFAFYFIPAMGCRRLVHYAFTRRVYSTDLPYGSLLVSTLRQSRGTASAVHSGRAPATRRALCPVTPRAAAIRRVHAPVAAPPGEDCPADFPSVARWGVPVSQAEFRAVRSASTVQPKWSCPLLGARSINGARAAMFLVERERNLAGGSSGSYQKRVAAGPAGLGITARAHVGDAVVQPVVLRQMFDHHRTRP